MSQMTSNDYKIIDVQLLRVGMHVELELGWMSHPFPTNSFKITSEKQLEAIRKLGHPTVRISISKSEAVAPPQNNALTTAIPADSGVVAEDSVVQKARASALQAQYESLVQCERKFSETMQQYRTVVAQISSNPAAAAQTASQTVNEFVSAMISDGDTAIRLLSGATGDRSAMHPVNVTVISLLLGKAMGLGQSELSDLGMAAFLHDAGKLELPDRVRYMDPKFAPAEIKAYQEHVALGVAVGQRMGLSRAVLFNIAQHHEMADGSGFPSHIAATSMVMGARILALVNRFDNLCNPIRSGSAMTPHEALSSLFAQHKTKFDTAVLSAFIRMMGVYPPGSLVQLIDDRHAMVVSVNSMRPLKPRVIVHDPKVPKHEALILDLEKTPQLAIRRSLKPSGLPSAAMDYLEPRSRICYFFERNEQEQESVEMA